MKDNSNTPTSGKESREQSFSGTQPNHYRNVDARQLKDAMRGKWLDFLSATCPVLRPAIATVGTSQHHPAPGCHTSVNGDAFRFLPDAPETGLGICNTCGPLDAFRLLEIILGWKFAMALAYAAIWLGIVPAMSMPPIVLPPVPPRRARVNHSLGAKVFAHASILRHKDEAVGLAAPEAEPARLFLKARGFEGILDQILSIPTLRFHPACPYWHKASYADRAHLVGTFPALLCLVEDIDGNLVTIQRTYLDPSGAKAAPSFDGVLLPARKKLSAVRPGASRGAAVRLFDAGSVLAVGEGLESSLAAHVLSGARLPVWAAVDAGGLESIELPDEVREVIVLADRDPNGRGQAAAEKLMQRMLNQGRKARILMPSAAYGEKADWNDVLLKGVPYAF